MITLASDFGSPYPAAMRGVLLSHTDARLVDVAHDFPRGDVRTAAFWLARTLPTFPPAVHLGVVDPGVGTDRRAIVVRAGEHALVCPDNGLSLPAARDLADDSDEGSIEAFEIDSATEEFPGTDGSGATFDGRDVFAPAAAAVHEEGVNSLEGIAWLSATEEVEDLAFPEPEIQGERALGEVLVVDGFGTAITNVPGEFIEENFGEEVAVNGTRVPAERSYGFVGRGEALLTVGGHGNVELAVNDGRGDEAFGVGVGTEIRVDR
ncbi:SAM hydrolase/SAM-dependent halogenase family protein [Natronorarus salvus]|uniref:SAM hydrolase/SAM-dependent halogenase family protein n=1 Tax=Natronorarus salvus TaxID=3117733 RepID=UPI002F2697E2